MKKKGVVKVLKRPSYLKKLKLERADPIKMVKKGAPRAPLKNRVTVTIPRYFQLGKGERGI